jgi:farnesyl-diphosphate farnesyltransferase
LSRIIHSAQPRAESVDGEEKSHAVETDLGFCERLLPQVSRTFAVSIQNLSTEPRAAVCIAYLLCRIVDTVEDDPRLPPDLRWALFDGFDAALSSAEKGAPSPEFADLVTGADLGVGAESELCLNSGAVFRAYAAQPANVREIIAPRLLQMSRGMRGYCERSAAEGRLRIRDLPDLELYCYCVAGTVGELLSDLFLWVCPLEPERRSELSARAVRFGLGLQLVNILKDVASDSERGACYLPQSYADAEGLELSRLFDPDQREPGLRVLRALARRAREHLRAAQEYTLLWPLTAAGREVRLFCAGPLALALGTLREVEHGDDAFRKGRAPTVTRSFVLRTLDQMWRAVAASDQAESDRLLNALFERARVGVAGRPARPMQLGQPITDREQPA